jgi:hypothetical protein
MGSNIETIVVGNMTNLAFFERFAALGRIGLVGGPHPIDAAIRNVQKKQRLDGTRSLFSHAFFCEGPRADGWNWVLESDIDFAPERVHIGVQESRIDKYADSVAYPHLAILDFGFSTDSAQKMVALGLELLAKRTQYSLRDVAEVWLGLNHPQVRGRGKSGRDDERALVCSAFVQHLCRSIGTDLAPDIATKLTTPEDIFQTSVPHVRYLSLNDENPGLSEAIRALAGRVTRQRA